MVQHPQRTHGLSMDPLAILWQPQTQRVVLVVKSRVGHIVPCLLSLLDSEENTTFTSTEMQPFRMAWGGEEDEYGYEYDDEEDEEEDLFDEDEDDFYEDEDEDEDLDDDYDDLDDDLEDDELEIDVDEDEEDEF